MAFICAGMGGGTGTGGAPIIAKICRELGILTVGIVTTPFGFEGPRRLQQAEAGIKQLEPYVDTLLVISNDKLRIQYGNLKMKDAFGKADNVLATAAKCITDIINSRGHIIVDFADVCTVMKNGGVAILGSAAVSGEERAQRAIENALNSPLLNDNDIQGAKWILININSAEGDEECTMDELEVINNHLRLQAGENTDVIVGMGYDNTLDDKIGITLIATGFEHKDPFAKREPAKAPEPKPEKITMELRLDGEEKKPAMQQQKLSFEDKDPFAPSLVEITQQSAAPIIIDEAKVIAEKQSAEPLRFELSTSITAEPKVEERKEEKAPEVEEHLRMEYTEKSSVSVTPPSGFLSRPSNIYASMPEQKQVQEQPKPVVEQPQQVPPPQPQAQPQFVQQPQQPQQPQRPVYQPEPEMPPYVAPVMRQEPAEEEVQFGFVEKDNVNMNAPVVPATGSYEMMSDEEEDQKRRAAERIQKLRNLSFNMNSAEMNTEFDNVPAYVRRNMELFGNTLTSVENYYSKYAVKKDDHDQGQISSINTFLDGKKPD